MSRKRQKPRRAAQVARRPNRSSRSAARVGESRADEPVVALPEGCEPRRGGDPEAPRGDEVGQPTPDADAALRGLATVARERATLREREDRLVRLAREAGASWGAIGRALGCSRQWARERHIDRAPER